MADWAIPQQAKLKYTQLFNLHDRSRSGFLSGLQCRDILLQSGLHRNVLAEIWNLSDIDGDGQLTREEFILAMHLTNQVRSGQSLPTELPPDLVPPSYRRTRSISATSVNSATSASSSVSGGNNEDQVSQKSSESVATAVGSVLNSNSFEDKRRENFEKGRAELERRRLKMIEQQSSIIKEQLEASKKQVAEAKAKIDSMRSERDTKMGLITSLEAQLKTVRDRKAYLQQEELNLIAIAKDLNLVNPAQAELDELATQSKQQSINQMKMKLDEFSAEKEKKARELSDITNRLEDTKKELKDVSERVREVYTTYEEKISKARVVREQIINESKSKTVDLDSVWGADAGFDNPGPIKPEPISNAAEDPWAAKIDLDSCSNIGFEQSHDSAAGSILGQAFEGSKGGNEFKEVPAKKVKRYRALYAFDARNPDELTINPGDTIIGSGEICEPGWLSGQISDRTGLFPEAYVEPIEEENKEEKEEKTSGSASQETSSTQNQLIETLEKNLTITHAVRYRVLYAFEARNPDELSINPGEIVTGNDGAHEPGWLCGELNGQRGLFPEAYVEKISDTESQQENQPGKSRSKKAEVATVIANYRALGQEQLNLEKGQLVLIRRKMDSGWWEGEIQVKESEPGSSRELDYLISELLESELDYVNDLKLCKLAYIAPLSKSFDVSNIFVCWDQLLYTHESKLEIVSKSSSLDRSLVLSSFIDLLNSTTNLYIDFCSRQTESTKNFEAKVVSDMRFRQLFNECQRNLHKSLENYSNSNQKPPSLINNWYSRALGTAKLPLTNFLIKPMQRITKYSLIFTKILEITSKLSDEKSLNLAREVKTAAIRLCEQVNDACRRKEDSEHNKRILAWAQSHIKQGLNQDSNLDLSGTTGDLEQPGFDSKFNELIVFDSPTSFMGERRLLKAGCMNKLRSGRELVLFLFNDILLITFIRSGSILRVDDVFQSTKAQQAYYKLYKDPILIEHLMLVDMSRNRRSSWIEKQSVLVSFTNQSNGDLYELLALSTPEKSLWIQELERASMEARNARAIYETRHSLRSMRRLDVSLCMGRLFVTILEVKVSFLQEVSETSSLRVNKKAAIIPSVGPLISVQIQLKKRNVPDLLQSRQGIIPLSDAYRTSPRQFNLNQKHLAIDEQRKDHAINYSDECTQFLIPRANTNDGIDILEICLLNVSEYSPNRIIARRRLKLDSLTSDCSQPGIINRGIEQRLGNQECMKTDRPSEHTFKLKPVDCTNERQRRTSFFGRSSHSPSQGLGDDLSFEIKLRSHLQLFCDNNIL